LRPSAIVHDAVIDFTGHDFGFGDCLPSGYPQFHLIHDDGGEVRQIVDLLLVNRAGFLIDDAKCA
jgi:hypothetical protein